MDGESQMMRKKGSKVLLMGKSGSGKTSMRSIIFANYIARDTSRLAATIKEEISHITFLGNLTLNLWDCGGQETFMENYFKSQKRHIFSSVEVLIYVFDIETTALEGDKDYFRRTLKKIQKFSPTAKIFCLIHKMDLIAEDERVQAFQERAKELIALSEPMDVVCWPTSIWDETLYKAWSQIVYALVPNINVIEQRLRKFCRICEADEVVLFERSTFLVISHASTIEHVDVHRFEKISNIIKQFKLGCCKIGGAHFEKMEVRNSNFSAFIDLFTQNTYIMVIMSDPTIQSSATLVNIQAARQYFEKYLTRAQ